MPALEALRARLAELSDLGALGRLAAWDQRTMMPAQEPGAALPARAGEVGPPPRRDWDRARRVPGDLAAELAQASADGQTVWATAREADDFATLAPALRRTV